MKRTQREFAVTPEITSALDLGPARFQARERAMKVASIVWEMRARGSTKSAIAAELNRRNVPTPKKQKWYASSVWRVLRLTSGAFTPATPSALDAEL
jgi:hypothetical protein